MMLVAFHFMKIENLPASFRELFHGPAQRDAIDGSMKTGVDATNIALERRRVCRDWLIQGEDGRFLAAPQLHQNCVHRNPVKPGRKSRVTPKRIDGAKHLQKGFLRKVLCVCCVFCHLQANRIYPLLVELKERGKGLLITLLSTLDNAAVGIA